VTSPSLQRIASDYATFEEYWDTAGLVSREEFDARGPEHWARDIAAHSDDLTDEDRAYLETLDAPETRCAYCDADVPDDSDRTPPRADDDDAWEALARLHADDCEWVRTRAHRLEGRR
jgi:hypothetical protein